MSKRRPLSYEKKKSAYGYVFISMWLIGAIVFFLIPFVSAVIYSFHDMQIDPGNVVLTSPGWQNYRRMFVEDSEFLPAFTSTLGSVLAQVPLICVFSLFIAVILNQKFRGRVIARAIFFLPVIITSGVVMNIINGDQFIGQIMSGQRSSMMFEASSVRDMLTATGLDQIAVDFIVSVVDRIFDLSWSSGIQILIFLTGLQSISPTLYEVCRVEGANAWVTFWKVTLPMIGPMIVVGLMYTIIDNFIDYANPMFQYIQKVSGRIDFAYASAMSLVNFLVIFLLIGAVYLILNRRVYYVAP